MNVLNGGRGKESTINHRKYNSLTNELNLDPLEIIIIENNNKKIKNKNEGRKMFYLTTLSTHFIYGYMASEKLK